MDDRLNLSYHIHTSGTVPVKAPEAQALREPHSTDDLSKIISGAQRHPVSTIQAKI